MVRKRRIDGVLYYAHTPFTSKEEAKKLAGSQRKKGRRARVLSMKRGKWRYMVFVEGGNQ